MINAEVINDIKIAKIPIPKIDQKKIRGGKMLPLYANVFICARKKSGKTTLIYNILRKCADKKTKVYIFCSTVNKDSSWIQIVDYLTRKGIDVVKHTSIKDDDGNDRLQEIIDTPLDNDSGSELEPDSEGSLDYISVDEPDKPVKKKRKTKKIAQDIIIILDDLSGELQAKSINNIVKINRHLKAKIIISSQYLNDLTPQARRQIDVWMLFKGMQKEKLMTVLRDADCPLDYKEFEDMYNKVVSDPYNFLYINAQDCEFRKNFNVRLNIKE